MIYLAKVRFFVLLLAIQMLFFSFMVIEYKL